jgi:hypothetical protein
LEDGCDGAETCIVDQKRDGRVVSEQRLDLGKALAQCCHAYCRAVRPPLSARSAKRNWLGLRPVNRRYSSIACRV